MAGKRIVIIDDEPDVLTYLGLALQDHGFEPMCTASAADGIELIRNVMPDLVCIDILMPKQTGLAVYETLRQDPKLRTIPVVIITGLNALPDQDGCLRLDGDPEIRIPSPAGFVEKPVRIAHFIDTVRRLTSPLAEGQNA